MAKKRIILFLIQTQPRYEYNVLRFSHRQCNIHEGSAIAHKVHLPVCNGTLTFQVAHLVNLTYTCHKHL